MRPVPASEQRGRIDSERAGDPNENEVARVCCATLDSPDVVLVDVGEFGEPFLRRGRLGPERSPAGEGADGRGPPDEHDRRIEGWRLRVQLSLNGLNLSNPRASQPERWRLAGWLGARPRRRGAEQMLGSEVGGGTHA